MTLEHYKSSRYGIYLTIYINIILGLFYSLPSHANTLNPNLNFEEHLCLQVKFFQGEPLEDLALLTQLGVKWVREEDKWERMEPVAGQFRPLSQSLRKRLAFYKGNNIGVIFILAYENGSAYPNSDDKPANFVNAEAYARYAAYMARALRASGVRFKLELWNEPHNSAFAKKEHLGGKWHGGPPSPWLTHYIKMVHAAVKAIKAVDETIEVMANDDMWIVHYFFLDAGLPKELDGLSVHPYSGGRPPEIAAVTAGADWTKPYQVVDVDQSFGSAVERLKKHAIKRLGKSAKIWITEWGWRVGESAPDGRVVDAKLIADYLPRAFILAADAGVESTCWFSAQDVVDGPMGLKNNNGQFRPAFDAFVEMSDRLADKALVCAVAPERPYTRAFLFRGEKDWVVAAWQEQVNALDQAVHYQTIENKQAVPQCTANNGS